MQDHLADEGVYVSLDIVSNILHEAVLHGRCPTLELKDVHLSTRLKFAKEHVDKDNIFWRQVLWSDEIRDSCSARMMCVVCLEKKRRGQLSEKRHSYSEAWWWIDDVMGLFSASGVVTRHLIGGIMRKEDNNKTIEENLKLDRVFLTLTEIVVST